MAADDSEATKMMAVDNTDPTTGDEKRDGSGGAPTDILAAACNTAHIDGANTPISSPQRQGDRRSPMKTPQSQRRHKKSQRLAPGNDEISGATIPAIDVDINNLAVIATANNVAVKTADHSESTVIRTFIDRFTTCIPHGNSHRRRWSY